MRAAIERHEILSFELEFYRHYRARLSCGDLFCRLVITGNFPNPGVLENRGVKLHRLLRLVIEPQERSDFLRADFR